MKTFILTVSLLFIVFVVPSYSNEPDSLFFYSIPEVVIEKSRVSFFLEDKKISTPDSLVQKVFSNSSIGELLSMFSPAYVNSSGSAGASSSVFLRGHNSYQTTVNWNGFTLNSLTLGTMDFSVIPAAAVQEIAVVHGASGSLAGSGNPGGSVLLQNKADWNNRMHFSLQSEMGTFDNRHFSFSSKAGNPNLQFHLFLFSHDAENNFKYTDIYKNNNPVERINNNALKSRGLMQNIFLRLPGKNNLEAGIWYQAKHKEIPAIMGSYLNGNAAQRDSSLRVYVKWTKRWDRSAVSVNTAMFDEHMLYRDKEKQSDNYYTVDSKIKSKRLMSDVNYRIWITDALSLDGGLTHSSLAASVGSYGGRVTESQYAAIGALKFSLPGFTANASMRKEFHNSTRIPLLFSAGAAKDLPLKGMSVKASYSDQFRIPTFNDKYWQPGGNPELLPESGYTADIGIVQQVTIAGVTRMTIETNAYNSGINNMITWVPGANITYWEPQNRKEVSVNGIEASVLTEGNIGKYKLRAGSSYNHVRSVITREYTGNASLEGNLLSYVPSNTASAYANVSFNRTFGGLSGNYTGSRHTSESNDPLYKMPSYMTLNGYAGIGMKLGDMTGNLQLRIMNLFNTQYQAIRSYPMPGRTFHISFSFDYSKPK